MAITIDEVNSLKQYLDGVMARADHHAENVNEIALTLIGGVVWKTTSDIQVREYDGETANVLWFEVNGKRYCFSFNRVSGEIEVKENSVKGKVITTFNNNTHISDVKLFFESLE